MKLDKKYKIERLLKYKPLNPRLFLEGRKVVVTNGTALAELPADVELEDSSGPLPLEAVLATRRGKKNIECRVDQVKANGVTYIRNQERLKYKKNKPTLKRKRPVYEFNLDAALLYRLVQAMGAPNSVVTLRYQPDDKGGVDTLVVLSNGATGIIKACISSSP